MGQRLVINIKNNGKDLANAYYHWSGYLAPAMDLVDILTNEDIYFSKNNYKAVKQAIRKLQETGATPEPITNKKYNINCHTPLNRNRGIICGKSGMESNLTWAESIIDIDFGTEEIFIDGLIFFEPDDEYIVDEERKVIIDKSNNAETSYNEVDFDPCGVIPFDKINDLLEVSEEFVLVHKGQVYTILQ